MSQKLLKERKEQAAELRLQPPVSACVLSLAQLLATPWTVAHQSPLSMGFSRQECWSGLLCPPTGDLPSPGVKPVSLMSSALADRFFPTNTTWEAQ